MKRFVIVSFLCLGANHVYAQADVKVWTRTMGSNSYDFGYAVAVDSSGNSIVAGSTQGTLAGGSAGRYDLFVAKYDAAGNRLWLRQRGTTEREFAYGAATDAAGNIYVTGYTGAGLDGNGGLGLWDVFVTKFDASGNWQWTKQDGSGQNDEGRAIATDSSGYIYVTGYVRGNFHGITRVGSSDVFISKYDSAGNRLWSALFGSPDVDESFGITCDSSGNVFVTGWTGGNIEGNPYLANGDNFLVKYDTNGQRQWLNQWGTMNKDTGYSLACDAAGNVYMSGYTTGPLYASPLGNRDYFLAKFDASGALLWGRQTGTSGHEQGWGVATDAAGNAYVAGEAGGSLDGNTYQGGLDIFLTKYDPAGTRLWTAQLGTTGDDLADGVAVASNGAVVIAGSTAGNLDGNVNQGLDDAFVMKFVPAAVAPPAITAQPQSQAACAGGTVLFSVTAEGAAPLSYQWQKNSANLSNGGHYSGVTTATLTISSADATDVANYRCVVTNGFGSSYSDQAALSISSGMPGTPTDAAPTVGAPDAITWGWADVANEFGYRVKDGGGVQKSPDLAANTTLWLESGLTANTQYTRRVCSFNGCGISADSTGRSVYTLALPPVYGTDATMPSVTSNKGQSHPYVGASTSVVFTATNGFGAGPDRVGKFGCLWDQLPGNPTSWTGEQAWTSGTLTKVTGTSGNWYLHLRAYNADTPALVNATVLNLGPYTVSAPPCLQNVGFEGGFTGGIGASWTKFVLAGSEGTNLIFSDETVEKHSGAHCQEIYSHDNGYDGGVYQQFAAEPGQLYTVSAWFKVYSPQGTGIAEGIMGIDPTGGIDPTSPSITWGGKTDAAWSQKIIPVVAQNDRMTVFIRGRSTKAASLNKVAYIWVDDVLPTCAAPTTPLDGTPLALSATGIRWKWTDVIFDVGYRVKDTSGVQKSPDLPANSSQWDETTGLAPNTQYTRKVSAFNDYGESLLSTGQTCYTLIETPLGVTTGTITTNSIEAGPAGTFSNLTSGSSGVQTSNTTASTNSGWLTDTNAWTSSGLSPNTQYSFVARARNSAGVETADSAAATAWTLSAAPDAGSVLPDNPSPAANQNVTWTAVGGFGAGTVQYYRIVWDQDPAHAWTGAEAQWTTGTLPTVPTAAGTWYLHVQGYNGQDVSNGTYDYAVTATAGTVPADLDGDGDVDGADYGIFAGCFNGTGNPINPGCAQADLNADNAVDGVDYGLFATCFNGTGNPPACQ